MQRILIPADKVLAEIGRVVLVRPLFSGILLISAVIVTLFANQTWDSFEKVAPAAAAAMPWPMPPAAPATISVANVALTATIEASAAAEVPPANTGWQSVTVKSGDTLGGLFKKNGLSAQQAAAVSHLTGASALQHLKLGQELHIYKDAAGQLQQLAYAVSDNLTLNVLRAGNKYSAVTAASSSLASTAQSGRAASSPVATPAASLQYVSGRVSRSLSADARKAGLSSRQANQLVQLFSQKNLAQNARRGDTFSVLYQPTIKGIKKHNSSGILAAQLTTRDKTYQLIRFVDPKGRADYYNPQGESLRDGLVREPLHFDHISSRFSANRFDPVLGYSHPHTGVDFAAPTGTPIQAAGDGVLAEVGYKGGYGKAIVIKHSGAYSTLYGHLSNFANNLREGASVQKGQIIGYVGQTGFATGPHLHYEIRVNDVAANPLTVALPAAEIPQAYRAQFLQQSRQVLAQLNSNKQLRIAQRSDGVKRS